MSDTLPKKCAVRTCPNRKGEGKFKGPLCFPCYDAVRGEGQVPSIYRVVTSAMLALVPAANE